MRLLLRVSSVMLFFAAATASAQPGRASPVGATADFLLAHTGDLALTDAQVVRLAAISRRTETRRKTMMARMDSLRATTRPAPGDSGRRGPGRPMDGPPPADAQQMQQMRDQMRADVRDAIAVLTPDQQASAWMMVASGPLGSATAMGMGGAGPGRPGGEVTPRDRGPISRPPAPRDVPRRPDDAPSSKTP